MVNLEHNIEKLNLNKDIKNKLADNNINYIKELWILSKDDLKKMGFNTKDINEIKIKLELCGIDLNKKIY